MSYITFTYGYFPVSILFCKIMIVNSEPDHWVFKREMYLLVGVIKLFILQYISLTTSYDVSMKMACHGWPADFIWHDCVAVRCQDARHMNLTARGVKGRVDKVIKHYLSELVFVAIITLKNNTSDTQICSVFKYNIQNVWLIITT